MKYVLSYAVVVWAACLTACFVSMDYPPSSLTANREAASFIVHYMSAQAQAFRDTGRYDDHMTPYGGSPRWKDLAQEYSGMQANHRTCKFNASALQFNIRCGPDRDSNSGLSLYGDQTFVVRSSVSGPASIDSPPIRLDPEVQRQFRDAGSDHK